MMDNIVSMDESAVSFHTPETKQQSKQFLPMGQPGPINPKVQASRTKQIVLAFFRTNNVPRGTTLNDNYIVEALGKFMKIFRKKWPAMAEGKWFFLWENVQVHTAAVVQDWLAARQVHLIEHTPYSPDLVPSDFFLFHNLKIRLAGLTLTQQTLKNCWEGAKEDFPTAFQ
jgi:histone-lysine N-methyltransferase SETMAR